MLKKKILIMFLCAIISALTIPSFSFAETTVISKTNGTHGFTKNWTIAETKEYKGAHCVLTYGFDKTLINEDLAYAHTNGAKHRSRIKNDNGWHNGPWKYANDWSDKEVRHKGTTIKYYHTWY